MRLLGHGCLALALLLASCSPAAPSSTPVPTMATGSIPVKTVLSQTESTRLRNLGAGCYPGTQKADLSLIARGLQASEMDLRHWAYLAVEKLCDCTDLLDPTFVVSIFPQLLEETRSEDAEASEFASRAVEALVRHADLLTPEQIVSAYEKAQLNLQSKDYEYARRGINLLDELIPRLESHEQEEAIGLLLDIFAEWQPSNQLQWDEYERELARGSAKQRFLHQAIETLRRNCEHMQNKAQVLVAYDWLAVAYETGKLDCRVLPSFAGLVTRLPSVERQEAFGWIVAGVSAESCWYSETSGVFRLANYASDALLFLAPVLDKDELAQALNAIKAQEWNETEAEVFEKTRQALQERLVESAKGAVPGHGLHPAGGRHLTISTRRLS